MNQSIAKMYRTFSHSLSIAALLLLATSQAFAMTAPDKIVKDTIDQIVSNIQENRDTYRADVNKLYAMVEEVLVPSVHVSRMATLILGKNAKSATAAQRKAFSNEFKTYLMRSYASALLEYTGSEKVIYEPTVVAPGTDKVTVKAKLVASDGQVYPVNLYMSNRRDTQWRAYNVEVARINFVATYRSTFGDIINKKGVDGLIAELRAKNKLTAS